MDQIIEEKKREVEQAKQVLPQDELVEKAASCAGQRRDFKQALLKPGELKLIAEIKKASPSGGVLRTDFDPVQIAGAYAGSGAAALSILTDQKFFQGDIAYLETVRKAVDLPILRKDFIIDQYQIYQSAASGADSILLIARILTAEQLKRFFALSAQVNLDAICEVHDSADLQKAL
ncbi:MAG: indole-3-glycerol-phosphate synthase, partial [Candidatus Omnitrophica bacterium]|nr:indole-3-glycerol-phosphate synthase [Candidatus Omnitrophota bacterium]